MAINKEKTFFIGIVLLAFVLRLLCLDKAGGLWYDEMVSYNEANQPDFLSVITYTLKTDVHLPTYQLFLHFWSKIFSFSDVALRRFSVFCGVLTVIMAFFVGKELKSDKTGLLCSGLFAISSFLIFYSQEVRMYSFLMLLSILALYFLIRIKNNHENKWNYVGLIVFSFLIILTYTIGFIFVFAQILTFILYLAIKEHSEKKKALQFISVATVILFILASSMFMYIVFNLPKYSEQINGYYCDWTFLFVVVQNWFTPVLNGLYNNPMYYFDTFLTNVNLFNIVFIFIPILIAVFAIANAVKKDKFSIVILGSALVFLVSEFLALKFTNFKILSRYTAIIYPNLLILVGYGLSRIDFSKKLKVIFISAFIFLNLSYLIFAQNSAFKLDRYGFRELSELIVKSRVKQDDFVVVWNRKEVLNKYVGTRLNILSLLQNFAYTAEDILGQEKVLNKLSLYERKLLLKGHFADKNISQNTVYLMNFIQNYAKPGQKFIITTTKNFDAYSRKSYLELVNNSKEFDKTSFNDLMTIKSLIDIKDLCDKKFKFVKKLGKGPYVIWVYEK